MKPLQILLSSGALLFGAGILSAQEAVVNGDFSSNGALFVDFPGTVSVGTNPADIDNWMRSAGATGINGVGISNPFGPTDPSAATYYAFLQNGGKDISQDITAGLLPSTNYEVTFLAADRNAQPTAEGRVIVADLVTTYYDSTVTSWDATAFEVGSGQFTTGASFDGAVTITLSNDSGAGDLTVAYSDVSVRVAGPPLPTAVSPADDAFGVNASASLVATFNEPIAIGSGNITLKNLTDATQVLIPVGDPQFSVSVNTITLTPSSGLLPGKNYAVQVDNTAIEDLFGNTFPGIADDTSWNFSVDSNLVANGDFSSNGALFSTNNGYVGGANPAAIDNWTKAGPGGTGINGDGVTGGDPFGPGDDSATPLYAFLQSPGSNIFQLITAGFQPNTTYDIIFLAANRNGNINAEGRVLLEDASAIYYDSTATNWGDGVFQLVASQFTTPGTIDGTVTLTLFNDSPVGDNTVAFGDVRITEFLATDPDGDLITTANEEAGIENAFNGAPTNPNEADSDFDGIDDREEGIAGGGADGYVTNPNAADTDGDEFDDLFEIQQGTNPILIGDFPSSLVGGNYVANGDFSANDEDFQTFPGVGNIAAWDEGGGVGINGGDATAGLPFADNGALDGAVAFIQNSGFITQPVFGMTTGETLYLSFDYNTRSAGLANGSGTLTVTAEGLGSPLFSQVVDVPVGGSNPFYNPGLISFVAPSRAFDLKFEWVTTGDRTALLDNILLTDTLPPETPQWDTDQITPDDQGGTGTWDQVTNNFWEGVSMTNFAWPASSSGADAAIFAGTAGTVTIQPAGITANSLDFQVDGYIVTGGLLTLDGSTASLAVGTAATTTFQSQIDATGTPVEKTGGGTLALEADASMDSLQIGGTVTVPAGVTLATQSATAGNGFGVRLGTNSTLTIDGAVDSAAGTFGGFTGINAWTTTLNAGGTLDVIGDAIVGWNGSATLNLSGGTSNISGALRHQDGGGGTINVLGGNHSIGGNLGARTDGTSSSTFTISDGTISSGSVVFFVGTQVGAALGINDLTVNLDGGVLETDRVALTRGPTTTAGDGILDLVFDGGTLRAAPGGASATLIDSDLGMDALGPVDFFVTINAGGATIDTNGEDKSADQIMEGAGALTKTGAGTLLLTAANTYGGGTTVSTGCLSLSTINAIPSVSTVTVAAGAGFGGIVGASNLLDADIQNIVDNALWDGGGGSFLVIDTNGADVIVAANITGNIGLLKKGAGNLTLTGMNTYSGATVIDEGTIGGGAGVGVTSITRAGTTVTIEFTAPGSVDVYRSPTLQAPWTQVGTNEPAGTFVDAAATAPANFYALVPTGQSFP